MSNKQNKSLTWTWRKIVSGLVFAAIMQPVNAAGGWQTDIKYLHYERNFEDDTDRIQSGIGMAIKYSTPLIADQFQLAISPYIAEKITSSGYVKEDIFRVQNDRTLAGFALIGELYGVWLPQPQVQLKLGRQKHKSRLLSSKTRVLSSTFEGLYVNWSPASDTKIYSAVYHKWSRRADHKFARFSSDISAPGAIKYLFIAGAEQQLDNFSIQLEYLYAYEYLHKWLLQSVYTLSHAEHTQSKFNFGLLGAHDGGDVFLVGAERGELDYHPAAVAGQDYEYNSLAAYIGYAYHYYNAEIGVYFTRFGEPWLEDNFSGDHGTNPLPANTIGPDLSNKNESVIVLEHKRNWRAHGLVGLNTRVAYAYGYGIENSSDESLGTAQESWFDLDVHYRFAAIKGLMTRLRYRVYRSDEDGEVAGVKQDQSDLRLSLKYRF